MCIMPSLPLDGHHVQDHSQDVSTNMGIVAIVLKILSLVQFHASDQLMSNWLPNPLLTHVKYNISIFKEILI